MRGNPDPRQGAIALHGFYFLYYGLQGVSIPFLPLWFASRGLDPAVIGLIVATSFLPKILSTPVVAHVADQTGRAHALIAAALAASLALFVCYPFSSAPGWLLAITLLLNAVFPAVLPLMDRMAIASGRGQGSSYTVMRACGSLGFAVVTLAGGYLIKTFDADWVMWLSIVLIIACLACVRLLPRAARPAAGEALAPAVRLPMLEVLRDRPLLMCIAAASLVQASNGFLYSYSTLYWTASGLSTALISMLWVVGVASEVLFFFLAPRILARTGAQWLILASAVMTAIRWAGLSATTDPALIAGLQLLQCFTLAGNNAAIMWYITRHVPAAIKTSAIALYALLSGGVFMFASIQLGGALYRSYAPGGFLVMSLCAIGAVPLVVYAERVRRKSV
ncbi:MFS transporter [Achromobacter sp. ACM04]|uniref:Probable 3-phenylpropionic acid transporter n=1 Tax=Achromobacter aegrifaciens TaxID=1287736 RepID=A0AAD2KLB7_ACHAE|nr:MULTISPECIES: MFS transporter [Achromobacter]MBD9418307.1 MFS transporter [Achromobacter sp. ACM04]MBD9473380.1 MFS transporter [Achromobacter sp. ACM01]MDQ1760046.1 MFS transporter [Achromobacter aegrifaciens]CUJ53872.1 Probable 3-phenylpropionic acid transporter [Achromobacter aegrifaciens]